MYTLAGRNRPLARAAAALVAFVYAYFGFVASLHHTDGFVPTGKTLVFSALTCEHTHAQIASGMDEPECGVCDFQANLKAAATYGESGKAGAEYARAEFVPVKTVFAVEISSARSPRGPPAA